MNNNFWQNLPKPFSVLAPMEDVTDVVFRQIVKECASPDVFFTEFTSTAGMFSKGAHLVTQRLKKKNDEFPLVAQVWGTNPDQYFLAAKEIVNLGFAGIDINMGCPVKKIVKQGACSALIKTPELAKEIIIATKEGVNGAIPVSVKTRMGFDKIVTLEWGTFLLSLGIDALTFHPRLAKELSTKPANWSEVEKIVEIRNQIAPNTVIIGNGDVENYNEIILKHKQVGVDGVMIGRGIFKDPFAFSKTKSILDLTTREKIDLMLKHANLFISTWADKKHFSIIRRFYKIYLTGFDGAAELRAELMSVNNLEETISVVDQWSKKYLEPTN